MAAEPAALRRRMVDQVVADDCVDDWRAALTPWLSSLRAVPRHRFIPDTVWVDNDGDPPPALVPLHREQDPDRWLRLVYGSSGVATQLDDGHPEGPDNGGSMPTSSASSPVIVALMLAALDAHEGHQVLEIGTGTGYNAALLAHRLGAEQVTTVEIDPDVATSARKALFGAGFSGVTTVTGDGALGYPSRAPYHRVIATAACNQIPYAWVQQTRPGGRIVLPWADTYSGGLVALTVADAGTAVGNIVAESSFMWLRQQRETRGAVRPAHRDADLGGTDTSVTTVHPHGVTGPHGARVAIGQRVPGCHWSYWPWDEDDPVGVLWLVDPWGSWAKLTHVTPDASEGGFPVLQFGPRRLWDEVEAAYHWWVGAGRPDAHRWRFTVTHDGQRVELD